MSIKTVPQPALRRGGSGLPMKTAGSLSDRSKTELANLAKSRGIRGWATMDKVALVRALSKVSSVPKPAKAAAKSTPPAPKAATKVVSKAAKAKTAATRITRPTKTATKVATKPAKAVVKVTAKGAKPTAKLPAPTPSKPAPTVTASTSNGTHKPATTASAKPATKSLIPPKPAPTVKPAATKSLTQRETPKETPARSSAPLAKDRILLAVSNPYWLNAYWEISPHSVQRAEAALRQDWHGAKLIIRLFDVTSQDTTSTSETPVKDITIQGGGQNWYIDVPQPPRMYRADIGYVSRRGEFYVLARSNVVTPPKVGGEATPEIEAGWDDDDAKHRAERILAMSTGFESTGSAELREFLEERTGRQLGPPKETAFGTGAMPPGSVKKFFFEIDAKLIVFGRTDPAAHLTLNNDPIKLNPDGTFRMMFALPDSRQIIPAVAASADGVEERTIVLAVERNTKHLDPMIHDQMNEV
jgi:hypothetical protein